MDSAASIKSKFLLDREGEKAPRTPPRQKLEIKDQIRATDQKIEIKNYSQRPNKNQRPEGKDHKSENKGQIRARDQKIEIKN